MACVRLRMGNDARDSIARQLRSGFHRLALLGLVNIAPIGDQSVLLLNRLRSACVKKLDGPTRFA